MPQKVYDFALDLEVRSVTCPGVWLCLNGFVSLTIEALGTTYETKKLPPIFPLIFHEVFYFKKIIDHANSLQSLKQALDGETLCCELIQWPVDCSWNKGRILAKYTGSLSDVLYSSSVYTNFSIDLLMKSSSRFPGILAPKINVITKIRIDELMDSEVYYLNKYSHSPDDAQLSVFSEKQSKRQKPVCHSYNYHTKNCFLHQCKTENKKNTIAHAKSEQNRRCQSHDKYDGRLKFVSNGEKKYPIVRRGFNDACENHKWTNCGICSEYNQLFSDKPVPEVSCNCWETTDKDLTYQIPEELLLTKKCEKLFNSPSILSSLGECMRKNSQGSADVKSRKARHDLYADYKRSSFQGSDCLVRRFDAMKVKCLCKP